MSQKTAPHNFRNYSQTLLGSESVRHSLNTNGTTPVALVYPNNYAVGMSSLGYQTVYRLFNEEPHFSCERAFYYKSPFTHLSLTLETQKPLSAFKILAFSLAYEMDYFNVISVLQNAGIPPLSEKRNEKHPIIMCGGVLAFYNPAILSPLADVIVVGEFEAVIKEFSRVFEKQAPRKIVLEQLADIDGIYVPSVHGESPQKIKIGKVYMPIKDKEPSTSVFVTANAHMNMFMIEAGRGCGRGCRFCAAGHVYHPFRAWSAETLLSSIKKYAQSGDRIGFVGAALSDFRNLDLLCKETLKMGYKIGLSSLRADRISESLLDSLVKSDIRSVTIAPEAGTERLRNVINKNLTESQILDAVTRIAQAGIKHLKLYFIIGLPTEDESDIDGIMDLTEKISHHFIEIGRGREIRISLNAFIPKPFTPFQWAPMLPEKIIKKRRNALYQQLAKIKGVHVVRKSAREEVMQALIANGSCELGRRIITDSDWNYKKAPVEHLLVEKTKDEFFPWEYINCGISKEKMWNGWLRSKNDIK